MLDLRYDELDAQTHSIADDDKRQYSQQTETERFPPESSGHACCQLTGSQQVLIADVEHTEEQCGNKCDNYENHRTFAVRTVMDMRAVAFSGRLRGEEERVEGVIERTEPAQFAAFLEVLAELLPVFIKPFHYSISFLK